MNTPPRAYSYVRMSTDLQEKGDSRRRQLALSAAYVEKHGLTLDTAFELEDIGVSAFNGDNATAGKLGSFLKAVADGRVARGSYLLVESLDRLSRQRVVKSMFIFLDLIRAGINIVTLADERVYGGDVDPLHLIMSIFVLSRAREESEMKSMRLSQVWEGKRARSAQQKMTGRCPMWMELVEGTHFVLDPARVAVVRQIFDWSISGAGNYLIMQRLNRAGVSPFLGQRGWATSSISKILQNRAVLGEMQPHRMVDGRRQPVGDPVPDYFPRILDDITFERAQGSRLLRRGPSGGRRGTGQRNLFTHVAKCARCGSPMHLIDSGQGPKGTVVLRCSASKKGTGCTAGGWNYEQFERAFLGYVREVGISEIVSGQGASEGHALAESIQHGEARVAELQRKRDRTFDLATADELGSDFYRRKADEIFKELQAAEALVTQLRSQFATVEYTTRVDGIDELLRMLQPPTTQNRELRVQASAAIRSIVRSLRLEPEEPARAILLPQLQEREGATHGRTTVRPLPPISSFRVSLLGGVERRIVVNKSDGTMSVSEWSDEICQREVRAVRRSTR